MEIVEKKDIYVKIDKDLYVKLMLKKAKENKTLSELVESAIREYLNRGE